jgi:hypothetical protein
MRLPGVRNAGSAGVPRRSAAQPAHPFLAKEISVARNRAQCSILERRRGEQFGQRCSRFLYGPLIVVVPSHLRLYCDRPRSLRRHTPTSRGGGPRWRRLDRSIARRRLGQYPIGSGGRSRCRSGGAGDRRCRRPSIDRSRKRHRRVDRRRGRAWRVHHREWRGWRDDRNHRRG